jgi:putative transposase
LTTPTDTDRYMPINIALLTFAPGGAHDKRHAKSRQSIERFDGWGQRLERQSRWGLSGRLAHEETGDVEHMDAEVEDDEVLRLGEIRLLAVDVVPGAERHPRPGRCLLATFIDWRGYSIVDAAAVNLSLAPVNLVVWSKTNAGMGSLYRSQHELLPLFKKGDAPHINNVRLGKRGRWRAVDQHGYVLDEIVQIRRDTKAARRLLTRLLRKQGRPPKRIGTDELGSYGAARRKVMPNVEHRQHKGLNNRAENSHVPIRKRERMMQGFRSWPGLQRFVSTFSTVRNHFVPPRSKRSALSTHLHRLRAMAEWNSVAGAA